MQPGDFVSYYARAADNDAVAGAKQTTTDLYFLEIRPLSKEYKRAERSRRRRGWRRRAAAGGCPLPPTAADHRRHLQDVPRPQDDVRRQAARELDRDRMSQAKLHDQVDGLVTA